MSGIKSVRNLFSSMQGRDKALTIILVAVFIFSLGQFFLSAVRFPLVQEKGVFVEGVIGKVRTVNPLFVDFNDTDRDLSTLIFSGLIKYDPIEKNFVPDLAESWERSSNGLVYTFKLRPNAKWHDGTPVTAADVLFTFDVVQDPGFKNYLLKEAFEGVIVDEQEGNSIVFQLPKPNSYFLSNVTVGIIPRHLLEDTPIAQFEKASFNQQPVGTGPYRVTALKMANDGDNVDLVAFPAYYGTKPVLERIRFVTFADEASALEEQSAFHAIGKLTSGAGAQVAQDTRFTLVPYTLNQFTALYFNTSHPVLKEKKVRQALALGLNKDSFLTAGDKRVDDLNLQAHPADPLYQYNREAAEKLLDSMGMKIGQDGFRTTGKGEPISLTLLTLDIMPKELVENIRNQWQTLGVRIVIERADKESFSNRLSQRSYDVLLIRQNLGYNRDVYPIFHSSQAGVPGTASGGINFSNFKSFRTDGLTEALRKEKNPPDKEKLLIELNKVLADEIPVIFLSTPVYSYALDKRLAAFPQASLDYHSDRLYILPSLSFPHL